MKKFIVWIGIMTLTTVVLTGCGGVNKVEATNSTAAESEKDLKVINIGYPSSGSTWAGGTLGIADYEGFLNEYLEPLGYQASLQSFVGAAPAIHEALVSKDLDFAYYAGMAGISAKANGIDTKLLTIQGFSPIWELVTLDTTGITDISQLKGKTIVYQRGTAIHEYALKVLKEAGLTPEDVNLVNMSVPEGISALLTGSADAAVMGIGQELSVKGSLVIHDERAAGSELYYSPSVLTGRTEFIEENKEATVAVLEALLKSRDWIIEESDSYFQVYAEQSGYTLDYVMRSVGSDDLSISYPINFDEAYLVKLQGVQQFLIDNQLIPNEVDFENWIDKTYLEEALDNYKK